MMHDTKQLQLKPEEHTVYRNGTSCTANRNSETKDTQDRNICNKMRDELIVVTRQRHNS